MPLRLGARLKRMRSHGPSPMRVTRLILKNWKNFPSVDVALGPRVFLVGPNASGKSNLLDAIRFLRDVVVEGGLQKALGESRGGLSKIRSLSARKDPEVRIEIHLGGSSGSVASWRYALALRQETNGARATRITEERAWKGETLVLDRPGAADRADARRLEQTSLESLSANAEFRAVADFLREVTYLHLVPQLLRFPQAFTGPRMPSDPYGRSFLERVASASLKTRNARLRRIESALKAAVPNLEALRYVEERGVPHLEAVHKHWRPKAGKQREEQFSDGTLRLIGLLWSLLEGESLLLLEEPELSLNPAIVRRLASMIHGMQRTEARQVVISTHSPDLLSDPGIGGEEILLLTPRAEGTEVRLASDRREVRALLESGMTVADAVLPLAEPAETRQLALFAEP